MSKLLRWNGLSLVCSVAVLAACSEKTTEIEADDHARPVKVISIADANTASTTRYPAVIDASDSTDLRFAVGGVVMQLSVSESDKVASGALIARLDARDLESSLASARASFANAEDEYQRAVRLAEQDAIATSILEQRKTQRDVAKAQLDTATKALADAEIRAPFEGVIASIPVTEGETVSPGAVIATLIGESTLDATINLPASVIATVPSQEDRRAVVLLEAAPDREIEAKFSEANLVADATSQTYAVTFSFSAPENLLVLPGMNATVVLTSTTTGSGGNAVSVPLAAVQSDGNGQFVWAIDKASMTVSRRDIQVAPGIGETVTVTTGLAAGDQIVGAGGAYLAEGVQVTPWN